VAGVGFISKGKKVLYQYVLQSRDRFSEEKGAAILYYIRKRSVGISERQLSRLEGGNQSPEETWMMEVKRKKKTE